MSEIRKPFIFLSKRNNSMINPSTRNSITKKMIRVQMRLLIKKDPQIKHNTPANVPTDICRTTTIQLSIALLRPKALIIPCPYMNGYANAHKTRNQKNEPSDIAITLPFTTDALIIHER